MIGAWWARPCPTQLIGAHGDIGLAVCGPSIEDRSSAGVVFAGGESYDAAVLDQLDQLQVIARVGIGYDAVDVAEATERGVLVTNTPDGPTTSTAEHTIALMMAVTHEVTKFEQVAMALHGETPTHLINPAVLDRPNCAVAHSF